MNELYKYRCVERIYNKEDEVLFEIGDIIYLEQDKFIEHFIKIK